MIAHAFPPTGGPGVQRSARFAKYLPDFGWTPTVWCAPASTDLPRDEALLDELPKHLDRRVHEFVEPRGRGIARFNHWRFQRLNDALRYWSCPDRLIAWAKSSLPELLNIVRTENIDGIYSTHSPASNHWLAWQLKSATGVPWVADFRDLWTDNYDFAPPTVWHRRRMRRMEDAFLRAADAVVGVSVEQTDILAGHVSDQRDKFATIYNGADESDFVGVHRNVVRSQRGIDENRFIVSFVGSFVRTAEAPAIVDGLTDFQKRIGGDVSTEFRIVGWVPDDMRRRVLNANIQICATGYVSHADAIREMVASNCLISGNLTTGRNCDSVVPAKIFEYQLAGRPIIHVGSVSSAVARVLDDCGSGVTVSPNRVEIADAVAAVYNDWCNDRNPGGVNRDRLRKYTRKSQTGQLTGILNRLTSGREERRKFGRCDEASSPMTVGA